MNFKSTAFPMLENHVLPTKFKKRGRYQYSGVVNQKKYISALELTALLQNFVRESKAFIHYAHRKKNS
jgi:hypothetical protein